jgi:uncharacterized membrane protein YoaK (UPF0700 family)
MPVHTLRRLTGRRRTPWADRVLGLVLAAVAGAANAGGFVAVHQYTSHMTGIVSEMADHLAVGNWSLVAAGLGAVLSFIAGAMVSTLLINLGRRQHLHSEYALPLVLEAGLMLLFGLMGAGLSLLDWLFIPATVSLLCFMMGLQNAMITKVSHAVIRTTHVTGIVTDIGIELGRMVYWNRDHDPHLRPVRADLGHLALLTGLLLLFFGGGVAGAMSFARIGYVTTVPLAAILLLLAAVPVGDDLYKLRKRLLSAAH